MATPQKPVTIAATGPKHTATLIMAHGLGDSGLGWVFLAEDWIRAKKFDYVKYIFPNAPSIPITIVWALALT
jgi:predicted esterase